MMLKRKDILQIDQESVIVIPNTKLIEGLCNLTGNTFVQNKPWLFVLACDLGILFFLESMRVKMARNDDLTTLILKINHKESLYL